jgi:hypothetical protein
VVVNAVKRWQHAPAKVAVRTGNIVATTFAVINQEKNVRYLLSGTVARRGKDAWTAVATGQVKPVAPQTRMCRTRKCSAASRAAAFASGRKTPVAVSTAVFPDMTVASRGAAHRERSVAERFRTTRFSRQAPCVARLGKVVALHLPVLLTAITAVVSLARVAVVLVAVIRVRLARWVGILRFPLHIGA